MKTLGELSILASRRPSELLGMGEPGFSPLELYVVDCLALARFARIAAPRAEGSASRHVEQIQALIAQRKALGMSS